MKLVTRLEDSIVDTCNIPKWPAYELQGVLKPPSGEGLRGKLLGRMSTDADGKALLTIENRILCGEIERLETPLYVMRKVLVEEGKVEYHVMGKITTKHLFRQRPGLIISPAVGHAKKSKQ